MARISQDAGIANHRAAALGVISTFSMLIVGSYLIFIVDFTKHDPPVKSVAEFFAEFPMHFQSNNGSFTHDVKFFSKGYQYDLLFLNNEVLLNLYSSNEKAGLNSPPLKHTTKLAQISLEFVGANVLPIIKGLNPLAATPVSTTQNLEYMADSFAEIKYANVFPGVDVYFHGKQKQLFYEFILSENADTNNLRMKVGNIDGAGDIKVDSHGDITVTCHGKKMLIKKPHVYRLVKQQKLTVNGYFFVTRDNEIRFKSVEKRELV